MAARAPKGLPRRANGAAPTPSNRSGASPGKMSAGGSPKQARSTRSAKTKPAEQTVADIGKAHTGSDTSKSVKIKAQDTGEKLIFRRLPPGLTEKEFMSILSEEWHVGNAKVDWLCYCPGKISVDPSKPSRPSRAYLHLMRKDDIIPLSQLVRSASWEDAKSTFTSPSLIGPPVLEFSAFKKIPGGKQRTDNRQGTIDQDPEFMAFLESLANPTPPKENATDGEDGEEATKENAKVTTPLVEFLKEKKANKAKEAAQGKSSKHSPSRTKTSTNEGEVSKGKSKEHKPDKQAEKSARENVKILAKKPLTEQNTALPDKSTKKEPPVNVTDVSKNRRAGISAAARILQRDLGLSPGPAHRRARHHSVKAEADVQTEQSRDAPSSATITNDTSSASRITTRDAPLSASTSPVTSRSQPAARRPRSHRNAEKVDGVESPSAQPRVSAPPSVLKDRGSETAPHKTSEDQSAPGHVQEWRLPLDVRSKEPVSGVKSQPAFPHSPSSTPVLARAFVKPANISAGVTSAAIKQALEVFGAVTSIDFDRQKGFAFAEFASRESLVRGIAASPIACAQTTIQVQERRDRKEAPVVSQSASRTNTAERTAAPRGR